MIMSKTTILPPPLIKKLLLEKGPLFIGADIAKDKIDLSLDSLTLQIENQRDRISAFINELQEHLSRPLVFACEATSRYHHALMKEALLADLEVYELNPRQVRDFAKSHNLLAKTDQLDAAVIARFIKERQNELSSKTSEWLIQERGLQLHSRLRNLIQRRAQEKAALHHYHDEKIKAEIYGAIDELTIRIESYLSEIESHIKAQERSAGLYEELQKECSVAEKSAMALLIGLPELGKVNRRQIAALAGLAPMNWDSGTLRGQRHIKGGRSPIRTALYSCAVVASRHHPELKEAYQELRSRGKCAKVSFVAIARKLLIRLNTRAKNYYATI